MATRPLFLYNPNDGETYKIIVSEEDFERAQTDMDFAQSLLFHGVVTHSVLNDTAAEVEDVTLLDVSTQETAVQEGKHVWEYNATLALIASMETHMDELNHPIKRKHVYENILNDLNSSGHAVNAALCQTKWKSLVRSYKAAVDNKNKTGRGPARFHFYSQMDSLLGEKPNSSCSHTLDTSNPSNLFEEIATPSSSAEHSGENLNATLPVAVNQQRKRKRSTATADNFSLLKQREEAEKNKERRHQERLELSRIKLALEERKIALLEKIINK